ncbi:protein arginine N-methyltransferase 7 isoform X2 [Nymphaea colorata]|uniref:protein arginine N-methyltransferase 7 isoform X2 n=1 Tax=Nymphaea colorata TaxID=210225 RepID=UPI00129EC218|nr:protein arginine N-methyltransferase 7 isoform X2 [Nymphaea colorata]
MAALLVPPFNGNPIPRALSRLVHSLSSSSASVHLGGGRTRRGRETRRPQTAAMSSQRMFQLRIDPATGNSEWVIVDEAVDDEPPRDLLSSTSYLDMLNDSERNRVYHEAIKKVIKKPCHVLDIGAGTGLLSMMAAQAIDGCDRMERNGGKGMVSACESYLPMGKLMRKILRLNGMNDKVHLFHKRSDELQVGVDLPCRADVLISEILDSELLGEGLLPTLQNAHDVLLNENCQTVPYRATTYGQLVESTFLWKIHDLSGNEAQVSDGIHLVPSGSETVIRVEQKQQPMHCDPLSGEIKLLSEPFKIFDFDFWRRPESHRSIQIPITAKDSGCIHAVISWWVLQLDKEGTLLYSTAPRWINSGTSNWCDHWKQCIWFTSGSGIYVSQNEQILLESVHDDIRVSYNVKKYDARGEEWICHGSQDKCPHLELPPERVAIYGDKDWRFAMSSAVQNALQGRTSPLCVVADDSIFLTVALAHLSASSHIISMLPRLRKSGYMYLKTVANSNGFSMDHVKVLGKSSAGLTMEDTNHKKVDLFLSEPFYSGKEGMLPWQQLQFWKERTALGPMLAKDATVMPFKGILRCCAMSTPDLWQSRRMLKRVEGFDHSPVNEILGACGDLPEFHEGPFLSYPIWQCGEIKELSEAVTIMEFNLSEPMSMCSGKCKVTFIESGICHGFALWIDWVMDESNEVVISTGPAKRYWKQGVKLLNRPVAVMTNGRDSSDGCIWAEVKCTFDPSNLELQMKHSFLSF